MATDDGERRVRVRGRDGDEIEWSRKAARRAGRLNNWLDDLDPSEDAVFSITETTTTVLRILGELCDDDEGSSAFCLDGDEGGGDEGGACSCASRCADGMSIWTW